MNQTLIEQPNSIKNGILKFYENRPSVSIATDAQPIDGPHFLGLMLPAP
jgi:hypothetical protein